MSEIFKVGIDIHGVIDTFPNKFKQLTAALVASGAEVHIVTGSKRDSSIDDLLTKSDIQFTHYFPIVDYLESTGSVYWKDGRPYVADEKWNLAKRDYCQRQAIDFMIDDSAIYRDTFSDISTTFLHLIS